MSDIAIRVENLSKLYHIGATQKRHDTLRDAIVYGLRSPIEHLSSFVHRPSSNGDERRTTNDEYIWALKDVSFEVKRGEVVGVIGRNGAGKSTLLKILSRITEPTNGRAIIDGRVGSLLEVGTGFHPELTGRENIYLNGAILGMKRAEIDRKFDEIVAFAEIEKFLDTPVKHYSSGMYVRLAFAVAAHLEPEILLVDEVLAVGDAAFQKKCLGKMGDVAKEGRTVLFVSHNMGAIDSLCARCMLMQLGEKALDEKPMRVIHAYLNMFQSGNDQPNRARLSPIAEKCPRISRVLCMPGTVCIGDSLKIRIEYETPFQANGLMFGISIETPLGQRLFGSYTGREGIKTGQVFGCQCATINIPRLLLTPGEFVVTVAIHSSAGDVLERIDEVARFQVISSDMTGSGNFVDARNGLVWLDHDWDLSHEN